MVDLPPPEDGQYHEYAAIGCINPAEMGRLKGRHDTVKNQDDRTQQCKPGTFAFSQPNPDEISTSDLTQTRQNEKQSRLCHQHVFSLSIMFVSDGRPFNAAILD
jgi:hypothetical protein